jgi:hypothetical protein
MHDGPNGGPGSMPTHALTHAFTRARARARVLCCPAFMYVATESRRAVFAEPSPFNPHPLVCQDGYTGLYWAAFDGHLEVVRLLLDSRADPSAAKKVHGRTVPAHA